VSRAFLVTSAFVLASMPALALACPTCFAGVENRGQYFVTFLIMTVVPLGSIAAIVYWLRAKVRQARRRELHGDG
jgi:hypothetical protein